MATMAADALRHYAGDVVVYVGGRREVISKPHADGEDAEVAEEVVWDTAGPVFEELLARHFEPAGAPLALPCWPPGGDTLTVWVRRGTRSAAATRAAVAEAAAAASGRGGAAAAAAGEDSELQRLALARRAPLAELRKNGFDAFWLRRLLLRLIEKPRALTAGEQYVLSGCLERAPLWRRIYFGAVLGLMSIGRT
eukprot:TRINITY_DN22787_c0_g1_i3.p1 TRINITY_DN22787_c0_g1~~TRINITY_DN22787_c0_g1_i3.p1  ORF type:complete len:195 (+),score=44.50 TRINITY_DN22787_c0_g1_i3:586-1170(+)